MELLLFSLLLIIISLISLHNCQHQDRIKLEDVKQLTFYQADQATRRRTPSIPQLKCVGGTADCSNGPRFARCYNNGSYDNSPNNIRWRCLAKMDSRVEFGKVKVLCEGYDYPGDPFILAESCGLEYTLNLVNRMSPFLIFLIVVVVVWLLPFAICGLIKCFSCLWNQMPHRRRRRKDDTIYYTGSNSKNLNYHINYDDYNSLNTYHSSGNSSYSKTYKPVQSIFDTCYDTYSNRKHTSDYNVYSNNNTSSRNTYTSSSTDNHNYCSTISYDTSYSTHTSETHTSEAFGGTDIC